MKISRDKWGITPHIKGMKNEMNATQNEASTGMFAGRNYRTTFNGTGYGVELFDSELNCWVIFTNASHYPKTLDLFRANKLAKRHQAMLNQM